MSPDTRTWNRPVVGASVQAVGIWYDEKGNIAGWIAQAQNGAAGNLWQGLRRLALDAFPRTSGGAPRERLISIAATTGGDGRFKMSAP